MEARLQLWRNIIANPQALVFGVCIAVFAVLIGGELWPALRTSMYHPGIAASRTHNDGEQRAYAEQIDAANLFGRAVDQNNLPQTNLQLILRAVFAASNPHLASAVIETSDGRAQVIKVGGSIGGDAVLQEVHDNRVVLSRSGVLETLFFPAPQESTELAVAQNTPAPAGDQIGPGPASPPPAGVSPDEIKRAAILQRLEELRARSSR